MEKIKFRPPALGRVKCLHDSLGWDNNDDVYCAERGPGRGRLLRFTVARAGKLARSLARRDLRLIISEARSPSCNLLRAKSCPSWASARYKLNQLVVGRESKAKRARQFTCLERHSPPSSLPGPVEADSAHNDRHDPHNVLDRAEPYIAQSKSPARHL